MHALLIALALGQFHVEPAAADSRFVVLADHHKPKHEPAKPATCAGDCCKCTSELAALRAKLASLKSPAPVAQVVPVQAAAPTVYRQPYVPTYAPAYVPTYRYGSACAGGSCTRTAPRRGLFGFRR